MLSRTNSLSNGPVPQQDLQPTGESKTEAAKQVPEAPVEVVVDARIDALITALKAHPEGAEDFAVEQEFYMLIADMAQMSPSLNLRSLDQLVQRTAMFADSTNPDVAPATSRLMGTIFREQIRPAVAGLQFQPGVGSIGHSRRKDDLLGEIDELLSSVPLVFVPEHAGPVAAYASAVDARRRETAEIALQGTSSGDRGEITDKLQRANARMREIADVYLAQGYDSPAAKLVIAIRKYKEAETKDKLQIYAQHLRPAIEADTTDQDKDYFLRSTDATCAREVGDGGDIQIRLLENRAMDRVIDQLAALFVK